MAGLKGITINTPPDAEPHVYAEDDAAIFQSIFGEDGVCNIGQKCKATVLSNNKVRIADGVIIVGGHFARIPYGEYVDCEIENGQSGKKRNDIIVAKFTTTGSGGIDTMTCEVKKGTPDINAKDPEITKDNIYGGGQVREFPLYRVKIEGISIVAVNQLFEIKPTNEELKETVDELNGNLTKAQNQIATLNNNLTKVQNQITALSGKIPFSKCSIGRIVGVFHNSSYLHATKTLDKSFGSNAVILSSIHYVNGSALGAESYPTPSLAVNGNQLELWVSGAFVNGHVLEVYYMVME